MTTLEDKTKSQRIISICKTTKNKYRYIKVVTQKAQIDYYQCHDFPKWLCLLRVHCPQPQIYPSLPTLRKRSSALKIFFLCTMLTFVRNRFRRNEIFFLVTVYYSLQAPVLCLIFTAHSSRSLGSSHRLRFLQHDRFSGQTS